MLQAEAQCYIGSSDCPDYLKKAEKRLGEEIERVVNYLDPSSEAHITKVVENELIGKQVRIAAHKSQGTVREPITACMHLVRAVATMASLAMHANNGL